MKSVLQSTKKNRFLLHCFNPACINKKYSFIKEEGVFMKNVWTIGILFLFSQSALYCAESFEIKKGAGEEVAHKAFIEAVDLFNSGKTVPDDCFGESMEPMNNQPALFKNDQNGKLTPVVNGDLGKNFLLEEISSSKLYERRRSKSLNCESNKKS